MSKLNRSSGGIIHLVLLVHSRSLFFIVHIDWYAPVGQTIQDKKIKNKTNVLG